MVKCFFLDSVILVGYFDNVGLFCGSRDQFYALGPGNETVYCTLSGNICSGQIFWLTIITLFLGISFTYFYQQTFVWAAIHAVFLFWAVNFPFSYRQQLHLSMRIRYAHAISILLALILPLPGSLIQLKDGFVNTQNPPNFCIGRNLNYIFYFTIIPLSLLVGITSCLFAITSWKIFKVNRNYKQRCNGFVT